MRSLEDIGSQSPLVLHPQPGRGSFLPRLGHGQQGLVALLAERGVKTTVSPLYYQHNPELSLIPSRHQLGSVLDPCTQIRQKPWGERSEGFRTFAFGNDPEVYEPDSARLSDEELLALAIGPIDAQRGRGATLLLTTFHVAGGVGTRGRDVELLLAQVGLEHFRREGIAEAPPFAAVNTKREIYATVAVALPDLMSPRSRRALADAYLALGADGYWVKIAGLSERASRAGIRAAGALLGALRDGGRPVVSCGAGQLYLALLADDVSASIGLAEGERFVIPATWSKTSKEGRRRGRTRMAYHPKYHWSFRVGSEEGKRAFAEAPCECGVHSERKPPTGLLVAQHAAILRASQAAEALDGDREDRREWLLAASTKASWAADDADVTGMHTSATRYEAIFEGLDAAGDDAVLGEQAEL